MSTEPPDEPTDPPQTHERPPTTEDHMDRLAEGDRLALAAISDALAPPLREYLGTRIEADHLDTTIQQILLELYRGRHTYIRGADVKVWAFSFARHFIAPSLRTEATRYRDVVELVMHGFRAEQIAGILDVPRAQVLEQLEKIRSTTEESLTSGASASRSMSGFDEDDLIGLEVDKHRFEAVMDRGGFGTVYRATHVHLGASRAIKVMRDAPDDDSAFERFKVEACMMQSIEHDNIVRVYDVGRLRDGRGWYAMEFLAGMTLANVLKKNRRLPWSRVARLMGQLCRGLAVVHAKHIVHGDIKPANCFVVGDDPRNEVLKVLDFGVARLAVHADARDHVAPETPVFGTEQYVAPELLRGRVADARADIYAIGVMMFELLTGRLPFVAETSLTLAVEKAFDRPPTLRQAAPGMTFSRGIERIVSRALAGDPAERWQSVEELHAAIVALDPAGRGLLPFSFFNRGSRVRTLATASLSALVASVGTAALLVDTSHQRSAAIEPELTAMHIETTLAPARRWFDECQGELADDTTRVKAKLLVLGATGQVINTELLGIAKDTDAGECISDVLFRLRFPRFDAPQEQIECEL